jgi:hypothetical protein
VFLHAYYGSGRLIVGGGRWQCVGAAGRSLLLCHADFPLERFIGKIWLCVIFFISVKAGV